ncbi:helix-turn-helix domain-containing protein [Sphaerisporangium sp. NPDC005288]|uniref:IclR family transcriptional regulator n=1 Tax=Sphaerisporangium sp. NPDC005288 TaxID=3155114 RepID=UPI0033AF102C
MTGSVGADSANGPVTAGRGVLEGAFTLLDVLERTGEAGLTRIAAESGLPKATAYRLLEQLTDLGAVEKSGGRYRVGARVHRLAGAWRASPALRQAVQRPLRRFARMTGATVGVCVLSHGHTMVIDAVAGEMRHLAPIVPGTSSPCWTTAAGRVLLACTPVGRSLALPPGSGRRELADIRETGVAYDHGELMPLVRCVAAPLHDAAGQTVAALYALVGASHPLPRLADTTVRVAGAISTSL